ncbi:MAG TPA: heavy metal translocating P-type ATPase [Clostridia bacterium]|nr:heavy metal translocating P-type ATPase [Clostridia bacterium]
MEEKYHKNTEDCCSKDGCKVCVIASGEHIYAHENGDDKKELFVIGGGVVLLAAGLLIKGYETLRFVLLLLAYALLGAKIIYQAIKSLFAGNFMDENMLMSIATFGALALGDTAEAVSVMLFYRVGEYLQELAVDRSRRSIKRAINMRSDKALVLRDFELEVDPSEVEIGEHILVKPGERIPLDGIVESGESYLDYSAITGESVPVFIEAGSEVMSGGINKSGALTIKVTKDYEKSTVSRIMDAVEDAVKNKPRLQSFITRFSRIYTPIVIALAVLVAIVPPLFGLGAFRDWIYKALLFLVISCPCALVLSVPLTFFAGLANASSKGVLFKGANIIEIVANAKAFAFDKTGTLTKGVFRVTKVVPAHGQNENDVLAYAAALERMSTHPVGRALVEADERQYSAELVTELAGYGISGKVNNKAVLAGNAKLMELNKITIPEHTEAGTVVYVAIDGTYFGAVIISDELKENAAQAVRLLKEKTGYVAMLTGDNKTAARETAIAVGTDHVYDSLLPEDKLFVMRSIREQQGTTIFVGDGINDAPVLAGADAGCTIGLKSTDAAVEAADLVLMRDDLSLLPYTVDLSRRTMRVARINVILALAIKVAVMVLGLLGYAEMWMAIFADVGTALLCVLIALTLMPRRKQK